MNSVMGFMAFDMLQNSMLNQRDVSPVNRGEQYLEKRFAVFVLELANSWIKYARQLLSPDRQLSATVYSARIFAHRRRTSHEREAAQRAPKFGPGVRIKP